MGAQSEEINNAISAFLTVGEIFSFDGVLDDSETAEAREMKLANAEKTITEIAEKKGITIMELYEKVKTIVMTAESR